MTWVAASAQWTLSLTVDGVDMTEQLAESVSGDAERGAARTLDVMLHFEGPIEPDQYTGRSVALDVIYQGVRYRRFTGVVDEPLIEPLNQMLVLTCSDQRVAQLNALSRAEVDALVGLTPHEAFVDEEDSGSEYAEVATAQSLVELHGRADGTLVAQDIVTAQTPRLTLDGDDIYDGSVQLTYAQADRLINVRKVNARVQRNRYWRRRLELSWDWGRSFADYLNRSHTLPNEGMWGQAVDALGWFVNLTEYTNLPPTGNYYNDTGEPVPAEVAPGATGTTAFTNRFPELITAASSLIEAWWTQQVTLDAELSIELADSIAQHGRMESSGTVSYAAPEATDWAESKSPAARPTVIYTGGVPGGYLYADDGDQVRDDVYLQAVADREVRTLYDAHADNRLRIALPWHADDGGPLELGDTVAIAYEGLSARGVVRRIEERFDIGASDAEQLIELSLCRGGSPSVQRPTVTIEAVPADALTPTAAVAAGDSSAVTGAELAGNGTQLGNDSPSQAPHDPNAHGYSGNYGTQYNVGAPDEGALYPVELLIQSPEVPAEHRDTRQVTVPLAVAVELPHDPLEVRL